MKNWFLGFLSAYLFAGFMIGTALSIAVPPTNALGITYIAVIWPAWVAQPWSGWDVPVPSWAFTFRSKK